MTAAGKLSEGRVAWSGSSDSGTLGCKSHCFYNDSGIMGCKKLCFYHDSVRFDTDLLRIADILNTFKEE